MPIERQQKILAWLEQEGTLKVSEISQELNVSEMTVYRDLQQLIEQQKIQKTSNGVALPAASAVSANSCTYCLKK